jgi:hypothetical protein
MEAVAADQKGSVSNAPVAAVLAGARRGIVHYRAMYRNYDRAVLNDGSPSYPVTRKYCRETNVIYWRARQDSNP